jgi:NAD-dependent DNA ligase
MIKIIKELKLDPTKILEQDQEKILKHLDRAYHVDGKPLVSDELYDKLRDISGLKGNVGCDEPPGKKKVKLPYWMGSLDKIANVEKFVSKYQDSTFVVSDKLDGISALVVFDIGAPPKMYTRGNGVNGQDISYLLGHINGIPVPPISKEKLVLRGELIFKNGDFKSLNLGENPRNAVAGLVNRKCIDTSLLKHVQFVCYSVIEPELTPTAFKQFVKRRKIQFVHDKEIDIIDQGILKRILTKRRAKSEYDIDGIVVTSNAVHKLVPNKNPVYSFAFKDNSLLESQETVVEKVEWNISKDGYMKPTILVKPVHISGVVIKKASGFNAEYIVKNKITKGTIVVIKRSGDVIPHIVHVYPGKSLAESELLPTDVKWVWNDNKKDIVVVDKGSDEQNIKTLEHFYTKIKVKWLSGKSLQKLYESGYNTPYSIYKIDEVRLGNVLGKTMAAKIIKERDDTFRSIELVDLMNASNTFGRSIGKTKLELIMSHCHKCTRDELLGIKGVSSVTADQFLSGMAEFRVFIKQNPFSVPKFLI